MGLSFEQRLTSLAHRALDEFEADTLSELGTVAAALVLVAYSVITSRPILPEQPESEE